MNNNQVVTNGFSRKMSNLWIEYKEKHPEIAQFLVFFVLSNGITALQMILMPLLKGAFELTDLINVNFQILQVGQNFDGGEYYVFNYAAGAIAEGGGGGFAYFLAVQIAMAIAQIINFLVQRNITFKSKGGLWKAAFWYIIAYLVITVGAAALQGLYKAPIYNLFMNTWGMNSFGETLADFVTMIINCAVSFWVFYPIFKVIFKTNPEE